MKNLFVAVLAVSALAVCSCSNAEKVAGKDAVPDEAVASQPDYIPKGFDQAGASQVCADIQSILSGAKSYDDFNNINFEYAFSQMSAANDYLIERYRVAGGDPDKIIAVNNEILDDMFLSNMIYTTAEIEYLLGDFIIDWIPVKARQAYFVAMAKQDVASDLQNRFPKKEFVDLVNANPIKCFDDNGLWTLVGNDDKLSQADMELILATGTAFYNSYNDLAAKVNRADAQELLKALRTDVNFVNNEYIVGFLPTWDGQMNLELEQCEKSYTSSLERGNEKEIASKKKRLDQCRLSAATTREKLKDKISTYNNAVALAKSLGYTEQVGPSDFDSIGDIDPAEIESIAALIDITE